MTGRDAAHRAARTPLTRLPRVIARQAPSPDHRAVRLSSVHREVEDAGVTSDPPDAVPGLTDEELALLRLVAEGLPIDSVAARLEISPRTVRRRMHDLCDRIGVTGTMQAVVWAAHRGLV
jgi:DNA-binding NarL/FixJ family response regulator